MFQRRSDTPGRRFESLGRAASDLARAFAISSAAAHGDHAAARALDTASTRLTVIHAPAREVIDAGRRNETADPVAPPGRGLRDVVRGGPGVRSGGERIEPARR